MTGKQIATLSVYLVVKLEWATPLDIFSEDGEAISINLGEKETFREK
jgi:hypothetical protein